MTLWPKRSTLAWIVNETLGVIIVIHELMGDGERPFLLALAGALMGLPFVLAADGKVREDPKAPEEGTDRWSHLP